MPEIPVYEPGVTSNKPGYYRALVLLAAETYDDVTKEMERKRYSTSLSGAYTSFEKKASPSKANNAKKKSKRKSGINQAAQKVNTSDLREIVERKLRHQSVTPLAAIHHCTEEETVQSERKDHINKGGKLVEDTKRQTNTVSTKIVVSCDEDSDSSKSSNQKLSNSTSQNLPASSLTKTGHESVKRKLLASPDKLVLLEGRPHRNSSRKQTFTDSRDESELEVNHKRYKIDPDYTPRRYEQQKAEIALKTQSIKKLQDLNIRHQEKIIRLEDKIADLEAENKKLKEKINKLDHLKNQSSGSHHSSHTITDSKKSCGSSHNSVRPSKASTEDRIGYSKNMPRPKGSSSSKHKAPNADEAGSLEESAKDFDDTGSNKRGESDEPPIRSSIGKKSSSTDQSGSSKKSVTQDLQPDLLNKSDKRTATRALDEMDSFNKESSKDQELSPTMDNRFSPLSLCEVTYDDDKSDDTQSLAENNVSDAEDSEALVKGISASKEIWDFIKTIKSGEKGDLRFVKDLSIVVFGPETLAACSIKGTKRGAHKAQDGGPLKREALDEDKLKKVYDCLVQRVTQERGENAKGNPRLATARFHSALRQVQKRLRLAGYGQATKSNETTMDLLADR